MKEKKYKYITIFPAPKEDEKLNDRLVYGIINNRNKDAIGYLYYDRKWKQFVFQSVPDCIFSTGCLEDIKSYMEELNKEEKQQEVNLRFPDEKPGYPSRRNAELP